MMTAAMPNMKKRPPNARKVLLASALIALAALLLVGGFLLLRQANGADHVDLEQVRSDLIRDLTDHRGEYDEQSIVLADTDKRTAKSLAKKLGADLRITLDGSFATLTLPDGVTFLDIAGNEAYMADLPHMSIDYQARISEVGDAQGGVRQPMRPQYTVTDGSYRLQTYLDYLNLRNAWAYTKGQGVTVAVIDSGIDTDHPEFTGRISPYSYNATEDKIVKDYVLADGSYDWSLIEDEQGHGTAVAGVLGANANSGEIVGVAPEVTLLVIKAECDANGTFERASDLVFGLYYAIERDVSVVNMSFGSDINVFASAARLAVDSDIVCVAAAGNEATANLTFPAADENVIGVGALEEGGWALAQYSNYGENVDLVAPGTTYTAIMGGAYAKKDGTSLAAPVVAGVIALYASQNQYEEVADVVALLRASCYDLGDVGPDCYFGYGAIDAYALILEERGTVTFHMMTDELENTTKTFIRNHTLQDIPVPDRLYAVFDGWYYDPQCTEPYAWYEDEFSSDLTLYAGWANEEDGVPYIYVELEDGTVEIRAYTGHRRYITIPDRIDGKIVSSIGVSAFSGESNLREVNLPAHLVRIRDRAFEGCSNLVKISIPDTLQEIGDYAFSENIRLSSVSFGAQSRLARIGEFAFYSCGALKGFTVPASVTALNGSAFCGATAITAFSVQSGSTAFAEKDGVLLDTAMTQLVCYPAGKSGTYTVPSSVTTIGEYAFAFAGVTGVALSNVRTIKDMAFSDSALQAITIPDSVTQIGESSFRSCIFLTEISIGHGISTISENAFARCERLKSVVIPYTVREISKEAFSSTAALESVMFESNSALQEIGEKSFFGSGVRELTIPAGVTSIEKMAFMGCELTAVTFASNSQLRSIGDSAFSGNGKLTELRLPDGIKTIERGAFLSTGLSTVTLPASLTVLAESAFGACPLLTEILVDDANTHYTDVDGVVYDINGTTLVAYPAGNTRTEYTVKEGVTVIGDGAFYGACNLLYVHLPQGLVEIGSYAFSDTLHIERIELPDSITVLGEYSFYRCGAREYKLSANLQEIRQYALACNERLTALAIPDSVVQISNYAFSEDWNLQSVTFTENSKLPRISFAAFAYSGITTFCVPANVSTMAQQAFRGCFNLTAITFARNSKLTSISAYMFDGCTSLESIVFEQGSSLTSIQAHGLEGMTSLTSIDFGDAKITNVDNFAFRFCESLQRVDLPEGLTSLGRFAFYYCTSLSEVLIPTTVEHIGRFAFLGTKDLNVYFAASSLPVYLDQDWDHGIEGYYVGVTDVTTHGDWKYATLTGGGIAILKYLGSAVELDLIALDLGADILNIGSKAFYGSALERITLPATLTTIQSNAFCNASLQAVTIPASVQFIGNSAFAFTPITSLTFADGSALTVIEQSAFEGTESLAAVALPTSLTTLGRAVFKNSGIASVTFAEGIGITEVPELAFAYTKIRTLALPAQTTLIDHGAFRNTAHLESVSFGTADFMVMSNAFYQSGLSSLCIPANMTYVGEYAFVALSNLTEFTVDAGNPYYTAIDGLLVDANGRKLIAAPAGRQGSLTLPAGIEVIGFGAFEDSCLSEISFLPDANILSFGYRAFYNARSITSMRIPASVVAIDYYAFANCTALKTVTFATGSSLDGVYEGAFYNCRELTDIALPGSIDEISDFAFYACRKLTALPVAQDSEIKGIYSYAMAYSGLSGELTLPETLYDIGEYAFLGTKLTKVVIPDAGADTLVIGIGAFEDCRVLKEITLPFIGASLEDPEINWLGYIFGAGASEANATYVPESLREVILGSRIGSIGDRAFRDCASLTRLYIPDNVTELGREAFFGCDGLTEIVIGNGVTSLDAFRFSALERIVIGDGVTSIDSGMFSGCSALVSVVIGNGVTSIGEYAFYECSSLTDFMGGKSVTSIGAYAFARCTALESVTLPDSVTNIGQSAFSSCTALASITLPQGLTATGDAVFSHCTALRRIVIPDCLTSVSAHMFYGCSSLTDVTVGRGVTHIGAQAFRDCAALENVYVLDIAAWCGIHYEDEAATPLSYAHHLYVNGVLATELTIPEGVTAIGRYAFYRHTSLVSITLPQSLESIGEYAFLGCTSLCAIVLPDGVTDVASFAFSGCEALSSVTLGRNVARIAQGAFENCTRLSILYNNSDLPLRFGSSEHGGIALLVGVIVDKNGQRSYVEDGYTYTETADGFLFRFGGGSYQLVAYLGDKDTVTLPLTFNGQTYSINVSYGVKHVIIPDGMTSIGTRAFADCATLLSITLPSSITSIGERAFHNCTALTAIVIPDGVRRIEWYTFAGCSSLTDITFGSGVYAIDQSAFENCTSLVCVTIPDGIQDIETKAFRGCTSLERVTIGRRVRTIEPSVFEGCTSLADIAVSESNPYFTCAYGVMYNKTGTEIIAVIGAVTDVTVLSTVTKIPEGLFRSNHQIRTVAFQAGSACLQIAGSAFWGCTSLVSITLPDSVTSIGESAFFGCTSLAAITLPNGITSIGGGAFRNCTALTAIVIPDGVTSIGASVFADCTALANIAVPGSVSSIGNLAFSGCTSLVSATLRGGVVRIGDSAFYGCTALSGVVMGEGVRAIGGSAFYGCTALETVTLPASLVTVGDSAFSHCTALAAITLPASVTSIGGSAFSNCTALSDVTILGDVTSMGNRVFYYCSQLSSVTVQGSITQIPDRTFYNCSRLQSITLRGGVQSVGGYAFYNCRSLTEITLPAGLVSIGERAFEGCTALRDVVLPDTLESIGSVAFSECSALTRIRIPALVSSIGDYTFYRCRSLVEVALPASLVSIGKYAFYQCQTLLAITLPRGVTSIGDEAFFGCLALERIEVETGNTVFYSADGILYGNDNTIRHVPYQISGAVTLPSGVTSIPDSAFSGCTLLTGITIPSSVVTIGAYAFEGCVALAALTLPDSVTSVGEGAFSFCTNLVSVTLGRGVSSIAEQAFYYCEALHSVQNNSNLSLSFGSSAHGYVAYYAKVIVDKNGQKSYLQDGGMYVRTPDGFLFTKKDNAYRLIAYLGGNQTVTLPLTVNGSTYEIYHMRGVRYVIIPDGMQSIGKEAFYESASLAGITIPGSVVSIGAYAFAGCTALASLTIPDSVTEIGENAFYLCSSLCDVRIGNGVKSIGWGAFEACTALCTVSLGRGVQSIGSFAFSGCTSLTGITIPDNVTDIGSYAFNGCKRLASVTIGNGVKRIGDGAFQSCTALGAVALPGCVTSIGASAFRGCTALGAITLPVGVTSIGGSAFEGCTALCAITIPDSVTSIGRGAFEGTAYYNDSDNWEDGMLYIGKHLIRVPEDLKYYFLPQGTKSIAMGAFDNCFLLKKVCVPRAAAGVLSTLTNLETLVVTEMPSGGIISYFTDAAFVPLTLESVVLEQNVRMQANAFYGITDVTVYVSATQKDTMWDENFPGWNNRNKVIYGDKWIQADFYYGTGEIRSSMLYTTSQIIRVPWMGDAVQGDLVYVFLGFDIDGDGVADSIPATSANDLTARAVYAVYTKDNVCSGIGHTFDIWRELEAPNCTKGGTERRDCEYCDHYQTREIKAKGHDYTSVVTEPTCIDRGFTTYTCHCGNVLVDDYVKALDHKYGDPVTITKATCTQSGEERLDCERCDHFVKNEIPASHTYPTEGGGWTQTRVPSCTDAGEKRRDCEKCDHFETQPIGYAEHVYVPTVIAPTCTGEGYTLRTCDCGAVLVDTFVPAVGHAYGEWTITLAPSCTGSGEERRQCIHCDDTQIRTLQATGHADANADGACDVCGDGAQVDPKDPQGNSDSSSKGIVLIAAVGGGVAAAAVLCAVILAKKKKKK